MEHENDAITKMRELFNQFKAPYFAEQDSSNADQSLTVVDSTGNIFSELYQIVSEVINNGGVIPKTNDINKRAIYTVFEKGGIFPALRADPSLQEEMLRYAQLDLKTYPFSYKKHIAVLNTNKIPVTIGIIPNNE